MGTKVCVLLVVLLACATLPPTVGAQTPTPTVDEMVVIRYALALKDLPLGYEADPTYTHLETKEGANPAQGHCIQYTSAFNKSAESDYMTGFFTVGSTILAYDTIEIATSVFSTSYADDFLEAV